MQLISKINSSLDEVSSRMKVEAEQHMKLLSELLDFTSKNLEVLTVESVHYSRCGKSWPRFKAAA